MNARSMFAALAGLALLSVQSCAAVGALQRDYHPSADQIQAHMEYLASDALEGRDAGSEGYNLAAAYVANEFREMGLLPGGDRGTFMQAVNLVQHRATGEARLAVTGPTGRVVFEDGVDFVAGPVAHGGDILVEAPADFVGYGVVAPGINDFEGLDLYGKIAVVMDGQPSGVRAEDRRYVSSARAKAQMAGRHGAVGVIVLTNDDLPASDRRGTGFGWTWETADGDGAYSGAPVLAIVGPRGADGVLAGSGVTMADLNALAARGEPLPRLDLSSRVEAFSGGELQGRRESANVVAIIEGSDPALKDEYIVMSGHLDHVGVGRPEDGDSIYNGALDNAAGISGLIEAARGFAGGPAPRRSIIFLAVTGEEKGLIGSDFFAHNPVVPARNIVANVNLDMPMLGVGFVDVSAIGAEHSTIVEAVERAAAGMGLAVVPDPTPELGIFTRSDHYRFVEQGIPAVFLWAGYGADGGEMFQDFYANRYHQPDDDLDQGLDFEVGARWSKLLYETALELANQDERPYWLEDDLFGSRFADPENIRR